MRKKNRESLEAVTHTHTHTHSIYGKENRAMVESVYSTAAFYTNRQEENKINKVRVGANSTLKNIYKNKKESITLEN